MQYELIISYTAISILMGMIPGPSVLFTAAYSLKYNLKTTGFSILGQLSGNVIFLVVVFLGIDNLPDEVFNIIKNLGSIYIIYLGVKILRNSGQSDGNSDIETVPQNSKAFLQGMIVCLSNPKIIIHLGAILPQFISENGNRSQELIILCIFSIISATLVLLIYALVPAASKKKIDVSKTNTFVKFSGILMILAGIVLFLK